MFRFPQLELASIARLSSLASSLIVLLLFAFLPFAQGQRVPSPGAQPAPSTPPTGRVDDVPLRSIQLDEVSASAEQYERNKKLEKEQEEARLRDRNDRLTFDTGKILQLAIDLNQAVESGPEARTTKPDSLAEKLERYSHDLRITLSGHRMPRPAMSAVTNDSAGNVDEELRRQSRLCLQLALQLKTQVDVLLDPQHRNTVAASTLKTDDAKSARSPAMTTAESIESLAGQLRRRPSAAKPVRAAQ